MRYVVAPLQHLIDEEINVDNLRTSLDGEFAIMHEHMYDDLVQQPHASVRRYDRSSEEFKVTYRDQFSKDRNDKRTVDGTLYDYYLSDELSDEQKAWFIRFVQQWQPGISYTAGELVQHYELVYRVIQPHTSLRNWQPHTVPALFVFVPQTSTDDGTPVVPDFIQPTGAHDAYRAGDKVYFDGAVWEAVLDFVTWSPAAYAAAWKRLS